MAEVIALSLIENTGISISSAGLSAWEGSTASPNAVECVKNLGLSLESHHARTLTQNMLDETDLVLAMTKAHKEYILKVFSKVSDKTYTISEYAGEDSDISDPYGLDYAAYNKCAKDLTRMLESASVKWISIKNQKQQMFKGV